MCLNNQVCKDEKESREKSSAREISSAPKAEEVTPDFECNVAPVHEEKLRMGAKSDFSGNDIGDDFVCYSKSSDEKAIPDVPQWLTEEYKLVFISALFFSFTVRELLFLNFISEASRVKNLHDITCSCAHFLVIKTYSIR